MQGKERNNNEVDQEFTDFAWGEMSKLLDQDMPVQEVVKKPRRKKYLLLLLLLLISFSAGVGSMFFYQQQNGTDTIPEAPPPEEQAPYADAQPPDIDTNFSLVEQKQKLLAEAPPPKKAKSKNKDLENNSITFNRLDGIKFTLNTSTQTSYISSFGLPAIRQASEQLNKSHNSFYSKAALSLLESKKAETNIGVENTVAFTLFSEIDTKDIDLLRSDKPFTFADHLVKMKRKRVDIGLTVAGLFDDAFKSTGFQSGLAVDFNFDKKFSLNTGLAFTRLVKNNYQAPVALTTSQHLDQAVFGGYDLGPPIATNTTNLGDSESANFPIDRIDYLTIPATITYQFNRKLGFQTGVNFSYLLGSKNNEDYISSNDPDQQSGSNSSASLRGYSDYLSKNGIKSIDIGIGVGMRYFVTDNFGIGMNYNIGLPDYTKDRVFGIREGHTNNYFKLSLNYYMKKM